MKTIIDTINSYMPKSADRLKSEQIYYTPQVRSDQVAYAVKEYIVGSERKILNQINQIGLKLNYLDFYDIQFADSKNIRNFRNYNETSTGLNTLVTNRIIKPTLLFINGHFIPWEYIQVVINNSNYYFIITIPDNQVLAEIAIAPIYVQTIALPECFKYAKTDSQLWIDMNKNDYFGRSIQLFGFDVNGVYTPYADAKYVFYNAMPVMVDPSATPPKVATYYPTVQFGSFRSSEPILGREILTDTSIKLYSENVVLFTNGLLTTGEIRKIKIARYAIKNKDIVPLALDEEDKLEFYELDGDIPSVPNIVFDSVVLTIADGATSPEGYWDFVISYNVNYTDNADNLSKLSTSEIANLVKEGKTAEYWSDLSSPLQISMDRTKSYEDNVSAAIDTLLQYDKSIFNECVQLHSNIEVENYSFDDFMNTFVKGRERAHINLKNGQDNEEKVLLMVNGELYSENIHAEYKANTVIIPTTSIPTDANIEIIRFGNVNNNISDIIISDDSAFRAYDDKYVNENTKLFSSEYTYPEGVENGFNFNPAGGQFFVVDNTMTKDESGKIKISLADEQYYGKLLKAAHSNRFAHVHASIAYEGEEFRFNLGTPFKYCYDENKYMVFINGRRISPEYYYLAIPNSPSVPFTSTYIYLRFAIDNEATLDVIYTPTVIQDIILNATLETNGNIIVDKKLLDYGLSSDMYMVWVNGKKIAKEDIVDIDTTHMRIMSAEESIKNFCVSKYIDFAAISEKFKSDDKSSNWEKVIAKIINSNAESIFGIEKNMNITDTEVDIYSETLSASEVMTQLVREQYYANPVVDVTKDFVFDYAAANIIADGTDSAGAVILPVADADKYTSPKIKDQTYTSEEETGVTYPVEEEEV